jgi:hypothetical protein
MKFGVLGFALAIMFSPALREQIASRDVARVLHGTFRNAVESWETVGKYQTEIATRNRGLPRPQSQLMR